jgi:hypothetical protein
MPFSLTLRRGAYDLATRNSPPYERNEPDAASRPRLAVPSEAIRRLFDIDHFDVIWPVFDSLEAALARSSAYELAIECYRYPALDLLEPEPENTAAQGALVDADRLTARLKG